MHRTISTVARGTAFEQRSLRLLQECFSMSLKRVGGKSDGGIDLLGWWWLPLSSVSQPTPLKPPRRRIRVLAQCKAEKKKFSPNYVREMEGVWHMHAQDRSPSESNIRVSELGTVALLLSESKFTTATLTRALGSSVPFLLMHLPPPHRFLQIHPLKPPSEKLALLSGIPLSVVRKVFFEENLMFDGNVTREVVDGLGCGVATKECRTGRRMHMGSMLTLPSISIGD
ncbi:uncharacterized protein F5147DRAFT_342498 [Suillus discolor]|uniref:Required for respiratory growth protein 7, mitochondrial n=1 Tax=Suillus discolor TaxID=1912936 RepID=A0A9P7JQK2_9AGAM|nr:uncharacterized protein F5147DRAFT_342498 [Suillus discolor]KAG2098973.1 hypothetical protein F5147DRAFT_342498 [Suillus discolor]